MYNQPVTCVATENNLKKHHYS